ncbi:putative electron transfer flavoprotein subunit alpha, mitochondrial [Cyphellophora attinorum]|uniref:Probable electron transfer flavoprotein subunit alpha n=1 Tax=Cyphellophora attinorum TaxID=1664694 RepID=A0A0N1H8Y7_9EURO|nr:putative electron transfer flavoprotein subunit alpha, mitochondrial [Phialophora attinorum]KPI43670.1 putative electron transfer flavoprotein subunit alpha, mitochondrial [Phialophora attinorum]
MYAIRRTATQRLSALTHSSHFLSTQSRFTTQRSRLASTLAILEQREGGLNSASLGAVTAGAKLGGSIHGFIAGKNVKPIAEEASKVSGLEKIITVENEAYDRGLAENWAPLLVENIKKGGYTHVIVGHSAFGKNLLPRVAALLDVQQISDVMSIEGEDTFVRPIYAGNAILTVQSTDPIKLLTVRQTSFPPAEIADGSATIEEGTDPSAPQPTQWVSENLTKSDRPELATAGKVVSGGRGLKSKEEFDRLMPPLADALGAAIGAMRRCRQWTGKNVAPQLYLCAGISGAIQHLAGMKDSKVIACINKDGDAPIFGVADVGLVGDLFEVVPELTEKLKA